MDIGKLKAAGKQIRFDVGGLRGRGERTQQGFLRVPGNLTRIGVLTYHRADGSEFRELRHPDEVFDAASMGSLAMAPVTNRHPSGLVTPGNVAEVQAGIVTKTRQDGRFLSGDLIIQRQDTIDAVLRGDLRECSPGYTCEVIGEPGSFNGERYDGRQVGIVYNHLALGPRNWGRSGNEVGLHLDGDDGLIVGIERRSDQAPKAGMELSELQSARESRSEQYGIEILKTGSNLTFPADRPTKLEDYGDPVNLKYPLAPKARARNARARFKQAFDEYKQTKSRNVIHKRIIERLLADGSLPTINMDDPLDRALPASLRERIAEKRKGDSVEVRFDRIEKNGPPETPWCVVASSTGEKIACHATEEEARRQLAAIEAAQHQRSDWAADKDKPMSVMIKIDGLEHQVEQNTATVVQQKLDELKAAETESKQTAAKADETQGKLDAVTKERDELKTKLDEANDPKRIWTAVTARVKLEKAARKVLGSEAKFDEKTDREIRVEVVKHTDEKFDAEGKSDDYINGRFDMVIASAKPRNDSRDNARKAIAATQRNDGKPAKTEAKIDSATAARDLMYRQARELSEKPLRISSEK